MRLSTEPHRYIGHLLTEWARWRAGENKSGLGAKISSAYQLAAPGGFREHHVPMINPEVLWLDGAIKRLPAMERQAVIAAYTRRGSVKELAADHGVSEPTFRELLRAGKRWLEHALVEHRTGNSETRVSSSALTVGFSAGNV